jgi:predicted membrane-bound mannosyltransferase
MLTVFGASAVSFMMVMYALERRHRGFVLAFACGCALSSVYGFLAGTWPFGAVEAIWALIALRRYMTDRRDEQRMANLERGSTATGAWRRIIHR